LRSGHCAVDPRKIPYGSQVIFPDRTSLLAVDTGSAVISRKAARRGGRTTYEKSALVVDRFFETKRQALAWADAHPPFMTLRIVTPGSKQELLPEGGGMLAEVDILPGNHRTVVGVNGLHGMSTNLDRTVIGPYARLGFGRWGIFAEHDFTDRTLKIAAQPVAFRQEASYALAFIAVREWLVPSFGVERLIVHKPYKETQVAPRFELAARLSSNFTLGLTTRLQQNIITGKIAPSAQLTLAMKTVN